MSLTVAVSLVAVAVILAVEVWCEIRIARWSARWVGEYRARMGMHQRLLEFQDQRAMDNRRWEERVEQARAGAVLCEVHTRHVKDCTSCGSRRAMALLIVSQQYERVTG